MSRLSFFFVGILVMSIIFSSCRKEHDFTNDPSARLSFSADTLLFDTLFTTVSSVTKRFKIYNNNKNAVNISSIQLVSETPFARYKLNVDGFSGNVLSDIEIPGEDSIFVFVEVTVKADNQQLPFFVNDEINFITNGNTQKVQLISYGQNARFYNDSVLSGNLVWNNDLPYVIYGGILIDSLSSLTINPGVRIYMHKNAVVLVKGSLQVNGTHMDSVTFQGDRREGEYYNEPGQWSAIQFLPGSLNNTINYTAIKGSVFGVVAGTYPVYGIQPEVTINNSIIKYSTVSGIFGIGAKMNVYNTEIFACGQFAVFTQLGGSYEMIHNTFAQTNNFSTRQNPGVVFSDYLKDGQTLFTGPLDIDFKNNIVWGYLKDEFLIDSRHAVPAQKEIEYNLIRTSLNDFSNTNILNKDPLFTDPSLSLFNSFSENYRLKAGSPAKGKGMFLSSPAILQIDRDENTRQNPSTIGCYELF